MLRCPRRKLTNKILFTLRNRYNENRLANRKKRNVVLASLLRYGNARITKRNIKWKVRKHFLRERIDVIPQILSHCPVCAVQSGRERHRLVTGSTIDLEGHMINSIPTFLESYNRAIILDAFPSAAMTENKQ